MKICKSCGHSNPDNAVFCSSCGGGLANEPGTANNSAPNPVNSNTFASQQTQFQSFNTTNVKQKSTPNNSLVSDDEYVVATLTNGVVDNILSGEGFKTEGAVLTNKRLYYNHKRGIINIYRQEEKVNAKDITGTKIANFNPVGFIIIAILMFLVGIITAIISEAPEFLLPFIGGSLIFLFIYIFARKSHLRIEYAGGFIYFSVKKYGKENIRNFQKAIYMVKDHIEANNK